MRQRSCLWGIGLVVVVIAGLSVLSALVRLATPPGGIAAMWRGYVAVLPLDGAIVLADEFIKKVETLRTDAHVKAVVLRVNSPGGSVGASQEMYLALRRLREKKPLVASFGNIAASGGYYAGIAAKPIFALPSTLTASIGVRMSHLDASDLLHLLGLKPDILKSGAFKDIGALHRPMRDDERALLNQLLATMHAQFKAAVVEARGADPALIERIADGRVMTGADAKANGLIDEIGDLHDAINAAGRLSGLGEDPPVREVKKSAPWWLELFRSQAATLIHSWQTETMADVPMAQWERTPAQ